MQTEKNSEGNNTVLAQNNRLTGLLDWTGLLDCWTGLMDWTGPDWTRLLDWTGPDWTGLDCWTGLDWTGLEVTDAGMTIGN